MTRRTPVLERPSDAQGPKPPEVLFQEARRRRRRRWIVGIAVVAAAAATGVPLALDSLSLGPVRNIGHEPTPVSTIQRAADTACDRFARSHSATVVHAYPSTADGVIVWRYHNTHGRTTDAISLGMVGATTGSAPVAVCYMDHMRIAAFGPRGSSPFHSRAVFTVNERNGQAGLVVSTNGKLDYPPPALPSGKSVEVETYMTLPPGG